MEYRFGGLWLGNYLKNYRVVQEATMRPWSMIVLDFIFVGTEFVLSTRLADASLLNV